MSQDSNMAATADGSDGRAAAVRMDARDLVMRQIRIRRPHWSIAMIILAVFSAWCALLNQSTAEDRIVLRSLDVIRDQKVVAVDVNGLRLADKRQIGWDQIESVTLPGALNTEANRLLKSLGGPLFRIRQRMIVGDYTGLRELVEQVRPQFAGKTGPTALMVSQARMWGCLSEGKREEALLGHLQSLLSLQANPNLAATLPGKRPLNIDLATGISAELQPVWFDVAAAKAVYTEALRLAAGLETPRPVGAYYYCATLAAARGEKQMMDRMLDGIPKQGRGQYWHWIVETQQSLGGGAKIAATQLREALDQCPLQDRALALFWLARRDLDEAAENPALAEQGMLDMLRIVAGMGERQPELAGAALHYSMLQLKATNRLPESVRVRRELLTNYPQTYYGRLTKATDAESRPSASNGTRQPAVVGE